MASSTVQLVFLRDCKDKLLDDVYSTFFSKLKAQVTTTEVDYTKTEEIFEDVKPKVILVVDGHITRKKHQGLHSQLANFAREGGAVICCCNFSSFCRPPDLERFFATFGLQWKSGDYHRTDFVLNEAFESIFGQSAFAKLEPTYSMKALHVNHVPFNARVYGPTRESRTQSMVFPPMAVDQSQSPAVLERCGKGYVGYVGDVNNEAGSQTLLTIMIQTIATSLREGGTSLTTAASSGEASDSNEETGAPSRGNQGCHMCGVLQPIQRCGACHRVQYCSASCQKADWRVHKQICNSEARS